MEEKSIENEFDDTATKEDIIQLISRIRKLPPQSIDELWYRNEFVFSDKGANKAIPKKAIEDLLNSDSAAEELVTMLFMETHLDDMRKHLADIERSQDRE